MYVSPGWWSSDSHSVNKTPNEMATEIGAAIFEAHPILNSAQDTKGHVGLHVHMAGSKYLCTGFDFHSLSLTGFLSQLPSSGQRACFISPQSPHNDKTFIAPGDIGLDEIVFRNASAELFEARNVSIASIIRMKPMWAPGYGGHGSP